MLKKLKGLAKNILAITWVRKFYEGVTRALLEVFASNRVLAFFYSIVGFLTFNREQYAVLRARRNYYRNLKRESRSHVGLRRNIHRLEKGMSMQPLREVFAEDYIGETIEFYERAVATYRERPDLVDSSELEWAHDVLRRFFDITGSSEKLDKARLDFKGVDFSYQAEEEKAPFTSQDRKEPAVQYDALLALSMRRRSVRWFQSKPVPRELIDKALMVGRQSPTACNRLPYEFRVFDEPELVEKVAGIPFGAGGYSHQIPTIIVVVGKLDSYFSPRDRHAIYIDASLAAMPFMMALETQGLSSSVINWPDFEPLELKMQRTIGLDPADRVVMLIAVGYPDPEGVIPYSQKKSLDTMRSYNQIGQSKDRQAD